MQPFSTTMLNRAADLDAMRKARAVMVTLRSAGNALITDADVQRPHIIGSAVYRRSFTFMYVIGPRSRRPNSIVRKEWLARALCDNLRYWDAAAGDSATMGDARRARSVI